jgi:teichuronic acid biosynthesis glycosyltransferase TuaC
MKVLIVCSGNAGYISPFVKEQATNLRKSGIDIDYFLIKGKGWIGYLLNYPAMIEKIKSYKPSIIHAHYGLSGMLAVLQRRIPVIVTFHGSDINSNGFEKGFSILAIKLSKHNIFVSKKLAEAAGVNKNYSIISCGVDMNYAVMLDKIDCRKKLGLNLYSKYILFSSSFDIPVKNYRLAKQVVDNFENVKLIELKDYTREEVNVLMNACDMLLVTSFNEGGPLVVKEAIACGCPVVSTNVGDVKEVLENIEGCHVTEFSIDEIKKKIQSVLNSGKRVESRNRIYELGLDTDTVVAKIIDIYTKVLEGRDK